MPYYLNADQITIKELQKRIQETDLVPSRIKLLENIDTIFKKLMAAGISTFADLRKGLKNSKNISSFSKKTGIDSEYLKLLRREIEGYFPKAFPISSFDWFDKKDIEKLEVEGLKNTLLLYEALNSSEKRTRIITTLKIDQKTIDSLRFLVDLTRIQWISPLAARMLAAAGYCNAKEVAKADADKLCNDLDRVNKENNFFKGKIGLRDVKRLVMAASYVP